MNVTFIYYAILSFVLACSGQGEFHTNTNPNYDTSVTLNVLRVMTFNIRFNNPDDGVNAWPQRKEIVAGVIRKNKIDVLGTQEVLIGQLHDLEKLLPEYSWFGVGRDDGKEQGEYCAILYLTDRFEVTSKNTFWLSVTPDVMGSIGWDAACVRIVTYGKFIDTKTRKTFWMFNTHFDHLGKVAREKSVDLIRIKIREIAADDPFLLVGDFNAADTSLVYKKLTQDAKTEDNQNGILLQDARKICQQCIGGVEYTFQDFGRSIPGERIDYIFVPPFVPVQLYRLIDDREDDRYPSDHYPVLVELPI